MSSLLLDCMDPRLSLQRRPAGMDDALVVLALQVLSDALQSPAGRRMTAVSAPQLGLPVQVLAYRENDMINYLFDPEIEQFEEMSLIRGEPQLHCRGMARDVWRANRLILRGKNMVGTAQQCSFAGAEAIAAQQALDFCALDLPFSWMTPFHRSWATLRGKAELSRMAAVSNGLYGAPDPAGAPPGTELVAIGQDMRGLALNGQQLAVIDAANPLRPLAGGDRLLLAALLAFSGCRAVCFDHPRQLPVALALVVWLRLQVMYLPRGSWPMQAQERLGLGRLSRGLTDRLPASLEELPPEVEAIVLDRTEPGSPPLTDADLAAMARRLRGYQGALLVQTAGPDPQLEAQLLRHCEAVMVLGAATGPQIHVARRTRPEMSFIWARMAQQARQYGMEELLWLLRSHGVQLRKDGKRVPL